MSLAREALEKTAISPEEVAEGAGRMAAKIDSSLGDVVSKVEKGTSKLKRRFFSGFKSGKTKVPLAREFKRPGPAWMRKELDKQPFVFQGEKA